MGLINLCRYAILFLLSFHLLSCKKDGPENTSNNFVVLPDPPKNSFLADSPWPVTHYNSYAQASSSYLGPEKVGALTRKSFQSGPTGLLTMAVSGLYPDGKRAIWCGSIADVAKVVDEPGGFRVVSRIVKEGVGPLDLISINSAISGAYNFVDRDNIYYCPKGLKIYAYGDQEPGNIESPVVLLRSFSIPPSVTSSDDQIVGMNLTYDGYVAFATAKGLVGVVDRNFTDFRYMLLNNEEVSNSIACDEDGGIYVVTSKKMYRVQWTGTELSTEESKGGWAASYETGSGIGGIRLGEGSGSTPTLMGYGNQDKLVVLTDGQDLMHVVLMWRDKIPANWQQIPGTLDRRIAAQAPVKFGNPSATRSLSEQSPCVRDYGILIVNNELKGSSGNQLGDLLTSGNPTNAPKGVEKFVWDSGSRRLSTVWVNRDISWPNGIPCMSAPSNLAYCIGQNNGVWNFSALDWSTGKLRFRFPLGQQLNYNSAYAPTQVGIGRSLYSATLFGFVGMWEE
jgi:hypothetical protein